MGGVVSSLFGAPTQSVDMPETTIAPVREEQEAVSKSVRDTERRRLMARRVMGGTLLSNGNQSSSLLGQNKQQ